MQRSEPALRLLGLAARAGALVTGTEAVRDAVRSGSVQLVVIAKDTSENSRNKLLPLLRAVEMPHVIAFDRDTLGGAVGRAPLGAVAVRGGGFADRIRAELREEKSDD